ncbi:type IX secretion system periplasmic lipoprotein PorW/SprE [Moheibacter sediminis]|nr:hypothetical protein [Moheibacter sediminis]
MKKKLLTLACVGILVGCSTEKDSFKNRAFHSSTAWFNTLFNAEEALEKKIDELELEYKDNYSEILPVDPLPKITEGDIFAEADKQAANFKQTGGNSSNNKKPAATGFDLVEEKALKAIEKHSMLIRGKEHNKMMTRAYLILGKARYNKGKGFEALDALNYMRTNLPYHKKYSPEAEMYMALANIQTGNVFEGERILEKLNKDDGLKKQLTENTSKYFAQDLIRRGEYEAAIHELDDAIDHAGNKKRKARYYYIIGQLFSEMDMQNEAGEAFTRVYQLKPGFEMEVKAQLAIANNFDPEKNSYNSYKEHLLDVSKKGNYVSRKNEFYYAIGDMALKDGKIDESRKYLKMSFEGQASDPYIRGKAYETYANLEFNEGNYVHASSYYDSALAVIPYDKDIQRITKRSTSLKTLMEKYYLVKRNDSILKLAHMSPEEKETFFKDYIAKLKIEDEKKQKQAEIEMTSFQTETKGGGFNSSFDDGKSGGSSFYFYNTSQKGFGQTEFKRIWGNVRLGDNWRSSTSTGLTIEEQQAEMLGQTSTQDPRRYELEFYLEKIPTKRNELDKLKVERDTTELSLGIGYYDLFQNAKVATTTLEHLVSTPPKNEETNAQALYQIYRINNKIENISKADEYKNIILSKYPNSIYAEYILNPEFNFTTPTTQEALDYYQETYAFYKEKDYKQVKTRTALAIEKWPSEIIIAKFSLLNALAIGATEERDSFRNALELITIAYQNTDEAKKAQEIIDLMDGKTKNTANVETPKASPEEQKRIDDQKRKEEEKMKSSSPGRNIDSGDDLPPNNKSSNSPANNNIPTQEQGTRSRIK